MKVSPLFDLSGRTALVTGATKGIGRAVAEAFVDHGARVAITSRHRDEAEAAAAELDQRAGRPVAIGLAGDLADLPATLAAYDLAADRLGGIQILVCNASGLPSRFGRSDEAPPGELARLLEVNVANNAALMHHAAHAMRAMGEGTIIATTSAGGLRPSPGVMPYGVSKAALSFLVRCLAVEYAADNIRINAVAPGLTRSHSSELHATHDPDGYAAFLRQIPRGRVIEAEEIAACMVFLAGVGGRSITGTTIVIDGGEPVPG